MFFTTGIKFYAERNMCSIIRSRCQCKTCQRTSSECQVHIIIHDTQFLNHDIQISLFK